MHRVALALLPAFALSACSGPRTPEPATGASTATHATLASLEGRWRCDYVEGSRTHPMSLWIEPARERLFLCPGAGRYVCTDAWTLEESDAGAVATTRTHEDVTVTMHLAHEGTTLTGTGSRSDRNERVTVRCELGSALPTAPPAGQEVDASEYRVPEEIAMLMDMLFDSVRNYLTTHHEAPEDSGRVIVVEEAIPPVGPAVPATPSCDGVREAPTTDAEDTWYEQIAFLPRGVRASYQIVLGETPETFRLVAYWDDDCDGQYAVFVREVSFSEAGVPDLGPLRVIDPYE